MELENIMLSKKSEARTDAGWPPSPGTHRETKQGNNHYEGCQTLGEEEFGGRGGWTGSEVILPHKEVGVCGHWEIEVP